MAEQVPAVDVQTDPIVNSGGIVIYILVNEDDNAEWIVNPLLMVKETFEFYPTAILSSLLVATLVKEAYVKVRLN